MDYEKKYNKMLDAARYWHDVSEGDIPAVLEEIFPELREGRDEEIRKALINVFATHKDYEMFFGVSVKDIHAWLEKQGTPNQVSIWKHWKDGIAGNGEGKQIYLIKSGDSYILSSCLGYECDYIELSELDRLLEKQGEQKSAWSEEDEVRLQACIDTLQAKSIMGKVDTMHTNWLKSLKQRYTWKPSDKQMKALDSAIDEFDGYREFDSLVSLKKDLEKLKGE